jgi:hypothetical protein
MGDYIKLKSFLTEKETVTQLKTGHGMGKIFASCTYDKELIPRINREFKKPCNK